MKKISLFIIAAIASTVLCPALADPGDSGVVNGTDIKDFMGSGPVVDPDAMEDASVRADKLIRLDPEWRGQRSYDYVQNDKEGALKTNTGAQAARSGAQQIATASGTGSTDTVWMDAGSKTPPPSHKHFGWVKMYGESWKHFFLSTGNLMGFPVGCDDDGTGNLKPPDVYGNR